MITPQVQPIIGKAPPPTPATDFQADEFSGNTRQPNGVCSLSLVSQLSRRLIYAWLWVAPTAANDYFVKGSIKFFHNQQNVGTLPLGIGSAAGGTGKMSASLATIATTGGTNLVDSLGLYVGSPVTVNGVVQPNSVLLQPQRIKGTADQAVITIDELWNVAGYRLYFAVKSTN